MIKKRGSDWDSDLNSDGHDEAGPVGQTLDKHCGSGGKVMKERICLQRADSNRKTSPTAPRTGHTEPRYTNPTTAKAQLMNINYVTGRWLTRRSSLAVVNVSNSQLVI